MRNQIATGKLSCLLIMIELESRILFVLSMIFGASNSKFLKIADTFCLVFYHCLHLILCLYISFRYEEKRWIPRDGKTKPNSRESQEKASAYRPRPGGSGAHRYTNNVEHSSETKIVHPPNANSNIQNFHSPNINRSIQNIRSPSKNSSIQNIHSPNANNCIPASKTSVPVATRVSEQVINRSFVLSMLVFLSFSFFLFSPQLFLHFIHDTSFRIYVYCILFGSVIILGYGNISNSCCINPLRKETSGCYQGGVSFIWEFYLVHMCGKDILPITRT